MTLDEGHRHGTLDRDGVQSAEDGEDITRAWLPIFVGTVTAARVFAWVWSVLGGLALGAWVWSSSGDTHIAAWAVVALVLPALFLVDAVTFYLPNRIIYPAAYAAGLFTGLGFLSGEHSALDLLTALACGVGAFVFYFAVWFVYPAGSFGFGDVRLATLGGLVLGLHSPMLAIFGVLVLPPLGVLVALPLTCFLRRWLAPDPDETASVTDPASSGGFAVAYGPGMVLAFAALMLNPSIPALVGA